MYSNEVQAEVRRLILEGELHYTEIAAVTGMSRSRIAQIAKREMGIVRRPGRPEGFTMPAGRTYHRCPGCGARVLLPCLRCTLEKK